MTDALIEASPAAVPILCLDPQGYAAWRKDASPLAAATAKLAGFEGKAGQAALIVSDEGEREAALFGVGERPDAMTFRAAPARLPAGDYRIEVLPAGVDLEDAALAFALGAYRFDRYRKSPEGARRLALADAAVLERVRVLSHACALARDMVNTPANDLGPLQVETIAREIAQQWDAKIDVVTGDKLLDAGYPAVHAVGAAASAGREPRLIEIAWGEEAHPLIAIVGKGITFDTGGLDLKPSGAMRLMKKDMGGAAHALALGRMLMASGAPVRICVLLAVAENAVGGSAMRPGDVLSTRKGLTVEVGNTDAEGRLVLADALARAAELSPALTINLATLTGAARAALGPQVIPFYTDDDDLAEAIEDAAWRTGDPLWRMPLWSGYAEALESDIADLANDPAGWAQAGSVTAALFLKRFAPEGPWVHFDIFAWNPKAAPGRPVGAEVQAIRALYAMIRSRFQG